MAKKIERSLAKKPRPAAPKRPAGPKKTERQGWAMVSGAKAYHYYVGRDPLCDVVKPMRAYESLPHPPLTPRDMTSGNQCPKCRAELDKRGAAE